VDVASFPRQDAGSHRLEHCGSSTPVTLRTGTLAAPRLPPMVFITVEVVAAYSSMDTRLSAAAEAWLALEHSDWTVYGAHISRRCYTGEGSVACSAQIVQSFQVRYLCWPAAMTPDWGCAQIPARRLPPKTADLPSLHHHISTAILHPLPPEGGAKSCSGDSDSQPLPASVGATQPDV